MSAIARNLVCRLADFGLARLLPVCDQAAFGGTNYYAAPEQFMTPSIHQKVSLGRKSLTELSLRFMFHNVMLVCLDLRMKCLKARVCVIVCLSQWMNDICIFSCMHNQGMRKCSMRCTNINLFKPGHYNVIHTDTMQ